MYRVSNWWDVYYVESFKWKLQMIINLSFLDGKRMSCFLGLPITGPRPQPNSHFVYYLLNRFALHTTNVIWPLEVSSSLARCWVAIAVSVEAHFRYENHGIARLWFPDLDIVKDDNGWLNAAEASLWFLISKCLVTTTVDCLRLTFVVSSANSIMRYDQGLKRQVV